MTTLNVLNGYGAVPASLIHCRPVSPCTMLSAVPQTYASWQAMTVRFSVLSPSRGADRRVVVQIAVELEALVRGAAEARRRAAAVDDAVRQDHAGAVTDDGPSESPCVPTSKFDGMHVMWRIVGRVSGVWLAPPARRVDATLSPSMQRLPSVGE